MKVLSIGGSDPKTKELIYFFICRLGGDLGRTKLIKLAYLADLISRMSTGRPITSYVYQLFEHGPFDPGLYETIKALEKDGCIEERFVEELGGNRYALRGDQADPGSLSEEEMFIAERVGEDYGRLPLDILLDEVVYRTEPARRARDARALRTPLDMEACDNRIKDQLGVDLPTFLASKKAFAVGKAVPLEALIDTL